MLLLARIRALFAIDNLKLFALNERKKAKYVRRYDMQTIVIILYI